MALTPLPGFTGFKKAKKSIEEMTESEAHIELLDQISSLQEKVIQYKKSLSKAAVHQKDNIITRLNNTLVDLDALMMLKVQHELLSYIQGGGIPTCSYNPDLNIYSVSIPGSEVIAHVNPAGLSSVKQYCTDHDNTEAAKILCAKNEGSSYAIGDTSISSSTDNIP